MAIMNPNPKKEIHSHFTTLLEDIDLSFMSYQLRGVRPMAYSFNLQIYATFFIFSTETDILLILTFVEDWVQVCGSGWG